jgi:hypothetical protein
LNIYLYTTFFQEKKSSRKEELLECIKNNLSNHFIEGVTILNESGDLDNLGSEKLHIKPIAKRPSYKDFFEYISQEGRDGDIHILANTDIYFDEHIEVLRYLDLENTVLALSRWDTTETKIPKLYNHNDSQDVWIFKGPIKTTLKADFPLGVPRCDNRLLYELQEVGYKVINPAFSIKAYHIHKGQRDLVYSEVDNLYQIPPPYRFQYPHNMFGYWQTLRFNFNHKAKLGRYRYDKKKLNNWWVIRLPRKILEFLTRRKMPLIGYN